MKPYYHCLSSVKRFGGKPEDYIEIHAWFDSPKDHIADSRHRLLLHNSFGISLAEKIFGTMVQKNDNIWIRMPYIINSDNKKVNVRDIAESHVVEDYGGYIPSLYECFSGIEFVEPEIVGKLPGIKLNIKNVKIVD